MRAIVIRIAREAAWAPAGVFVAHLVLGGVFHHEPYVDPVVHFLGGMAAAFFVRHAARAAPSIIGSLTPLGLDVLAFGLTCSAAVLWEIGEFRWRPALPRPRPARARQYDARSHPRHLGRDRVPAGAAACRGSRAVRTGFGGPLTKKRRAGGPARRQGVRERALARPGGG